MFALHTLRSAHDCSHSLEEMDTRMMELLVLCQHLPCLCLPHTVGTSTN